MSEGLSAAGPSLPTPVLAAASALLACLLLFQLRSTKDVKVAFVLFAVWTRYMMSAFHSVTYSASPLGLSWNALGSCLIFGLGLLVIDVRLLRLRFFVPLYVLLAVILLSGLVNREVSGTVNAVIKYGYFLVLVCGMSEALARQGEQRFLKLLVWTFLPLIVFQGLSVVLGVSKATETDGSTSYIGGYNHEAAFSVALATGFVMTTVVKELKAAVKTALLTAMLAGLLLANYRTSIIAIVPTLFVQFALGSTEQFPKRQRLLIGSVMALAGFAFVVAASIFMEDRFSDVGTLLSSGTDLIQRPHLFNRENGQLMSGRIVIWNQYLFAWADGSDLQWLLGFGGNSWEDRFTNYAHNTLVSQLYEYGILGVLSLLYLWSAMFLSVLRIRRGPRTKLIAAHSSFILLSLATMPLWMIEGYIFYGLICGYTLFLLRPVRAQALRGPAHVGASGAGFIPG